MSKAKHKPSYSMRPPWSAHTNYHTPSRSQIQGANLLYYMATIFFYCLTAPFKGDIWRLCFEKLHVYYHHSWQYTKCGGCNTECLLETAERTLESIAIAIDHYEYGYR